ncbi:hypothetical protein CTAYLR_001904 [Chrysophaeum taylorii]|uniref:Uncharacterized protein n=1 Tax=Chrysophaeum taylorii TaxID=2483200 RepID=A0AAD7U9U9_9STRA|nr:hypothetical protein CTAYLR_001904 [Chrysophaeum taylorii]
MADDDDESSWFVAVVGLPGAAVVLVAATVVLFWALSTVCEERFVPALSVICELFGIPDDVAGATLMAAGASSPEVFSSIVALFVTHSSLGVGTVVGSEMFNHLIICAGSVFSSRKGELTLDKRIVARESSFYLLALVLLLVALESERTTVNGRARVVVRWPAALALVVAYAAYVFACARFDAITRYLQPTDLEVGVVDRLRADHILAIENEPPANFEDEERRNDGYASIASIRSDDDAARRFQHTPSLRRLTSTAASVVHALDMFGAHRELEEWEEEASSFACFLFRANRFYSRAKFSAHAWELRWCVIDLVSRELHTYRAREDVGQVEFFLENSGARRYRLRGLATVDEKRSLLELELSPIQGTDDDEPVQHLAHFLAPCRKVHDALVRRSDEIDPPTQSKRTLDDEHRAEASLIEWPRNGSCPAVATHLLLFPLKLALHATILDVRSKTEPNRVDAFFACAQCVVWLALLSLGMCACCETIGAIVGLSDAVIGITFSAIGTSLPNLVSSMVVARRGLGNMAVSNALGSNTFNILVGLGVPWLAYCVVNRGPYAELPAGDIVAPVLVLVATLAAFLFILAYTGFKLRTFHAHLFILTYVAFLVWAVAKELRRGGGGGGGGGNHHQNHHSFAQYQAEFQSVANEVATKLESVNAYSDNPIHQNSKPETLRGIEELLKQACDLVKQMDVEVRSAEGGQRRLLSERARPIREQLKRLQATYRETSERLEREDLLGGAKLGSNAADARGRLADANDRARQQTQIIRGALEIAQDTEQVALDITGELERNRETINSIRGHIADTSGALGTARGLIASMQKREYQQKAILSFVAVILFCSVGTAMYYAFK